VDLAGVAARRRALVSPDRGLEIVACGSFLRTGVSRLHDLAAAFRIGDPGAFDMVLDLVREALAGEAGRVLGSRTAVVALPVHLAGARNRPCERLIGVLAAEFPGLLPAPGALVRIGDAPEARGAVARDPAAEAATLRWDEAMLPFEADRVLLLDDVVRTGFTFEAAALAAPPAIRARLAGLAVFRAEG
jgi:predicted nucleotidyltransferase